MAESFDLVVVHIAQGEAVGKIIKSHLESEGIPVLLKGETAGTVLGLTVDGLGAVKVLVPREFVDKAKRIIKPRDIDLDEIKEEHDGGTI